MQKNVKTRESSNSNSFLQTQKNPENREGARRVVKSLTSSLWELESVYNIINRGEDKTQKWPVPAPSLTVSSLKNRQKQTGCSSPKDVPFLSYWGRISSLSLGFSCSTRKFRNLKPSLPFKIYLVKGARKEKQAITVLPGAPYMQIWRPSWLLEFPPRPLHILPLGSEIYFNAS